MRFEYGEAEFPAAPAKPRVGDVFPAKSTGPAGRNRGTRFWVVAAITTSERGGAVHHLLGLNGKGEVVSTSSYGGWVMGERERLGHCPAMADLTLKIDWENAQ